MHTGMEGLGQKNSLCVAMGKLPFLTSKEFPVLPFGDEHPNPCREPLTYTL